MSTLLESPPNLLDPDTETPASPKQELVYAGVFRRAVAQVIDFCIGAAISTVIAVPLIWLIEAVHDDLGIAEFDARLIAGVLVFLQWLAVGLILEARATSSESGATLGKRLLGVMVLRDDGKRVTASQALARHCAKFLSAFALLIGFVICCFNRRHQCLHDMVAGTVVTRCTRK
ncbi:MAG TPA: RDD family protein [Terriglobales bacterium]